MSGLLELAKGCLDFGIARAGRNNSYDDYTPLIMMQASSRILKILIDTEQAEQLKQEVNAATCNENKK